MRKITRFITATLLAACLVFNCVVSAINADNEEFLSVIKNSSGDELTVELSHIQSVLDDFLLKDVPLAEACKIANALSSEEMNKLAAPYIPREAMCTSFLATQNAVYMDYILDGFQFRVCYYKSGCVEKYVRHLDEEVTVKFSSEKSVVIINPSDYIETINTEDLEDDGV